MTLSASQNAAPSDGTTINNELQRIRMEVVAAQFKVLIQYLL
jgi:hypothetical protein